MKVILKFFIFLSFYQTFISSVFAFERIKLKDVEALTFYKGRYTVGRKPIAQLNCKSHHGLCYKYQPEVVQCQNVGFDGLDAQWKCNANLEKNVKFGKLSVNCEGYDYPNDPYIIAGSCGLEYELSPKAHTDSHKYNDNSNNESSSAPFYVFVGFLFIFVMIMFCRSYDEPSRQNYNTYRGEATAPPPAGFKTDYTEFPKSEPTYSQNSGAGFWTGLGLGGLAGYMFGNRNTTPSYTSPSYTSPPLYTDYNYYRPSRSSHSYQDDCYSDSQPSGDTYNAEGFGGTKRR